MNADDKKFVKKIDRLFKIAKQSWENGNNGVNSWGQRVPEHLKSENLHAQEELCDKYRRKAETLLKSMDIKVDYPGLWPSFEFEGRTYYSTADVIKAWRESANNIEL